MFLSRGSFEFYKINQSQARARKVDLKFTEKHINEDEKEKKRKEIAHIYICIHVARWFQRF